MVMEQDLSLIKELSESEQTAASIIEVYDQLTEMGTKLRRSESRMDSKFESLKTDLGSKIGLHDQQLFDIGRKLDLVLQSLPGKETIKEVGGSSRSGDVRCSQDQLNQVPISSQEPCHSMIRLVFVRIFSRM